MKQGNGKGALPADRRATETTTQTLPAGQLTVNSLNEKVASKRARRLATMPPRYRKLFERSWTGKASPRASLKAFCLECVGFERAAITECTAWTCPLWHLRPYQTTEDAP